MKPPILRFSLTWLAFGFTLCANAAVPVIFNYTQSAGIGDSIYLQGSNFGSAPVVEYAFNDSNWQILPALENNNGVIVAQLPVTETRLPDLLDVRVSSDNGVTWSVPVFINEAHAIYFDTDQLSPLAPFQVFGINLYLGRMPTIRFVDAATGNSQAADVIMAGSTNYVLHAIAPAGVQPGHSYQVYVGNGYSGNSSSPVDFLATAVLTGRAGGVDYWQLAVPWAADFSFYNNVYDVKTDARLGGILAVGNGIADDTWAINHAIQVAAAAGGGVVFLPAGTYPLHIPNGCAMQLQSNVVVAGVSNSQVTINYGYPVGGPGGYGVCFASHSGLANLTLQNVDTAGQWQSSGLSQHHSELFMKDVVWNIGTSQWTVFENDDHLTIEDSTINQGLDSNFNNLGPLDMMSCVHCEVLRSKIMFVVGGIEFDNAIDLVFENNQVIRDIANSPNPSTVTHSIAANFVQGFAVIGNSFESIGSGLPTNNDGEVINSEAGGGTRYDEFRGAVTSAGNESITDATQNFLSSANATPNLRPGMASIAIVSGNAMGQVRKVTSVSGNTVGIDTPWSVVPEVGAHYATFDWSARDWTIANNSMTGNFKGIELFNASAYNVLIQSNTLIDSDGVMISPSENPASSSAGALFNVIYHLRVIGNTLKDVSHLHPAFIMLAPREDSQAQPFGTQIIGASILSNSVTGSIPNTRVTNSGWDDYKVSSEGFLNLYYWQSPGAYVSVDVPPLLGSIFQGNSATNSNAAFVLNTGAMATVMTNSYVHNSSELIEDTPIQGATQGSIGSLNGTQMSLFPIGPVSSSDLVSPIATNTGMRAIAMGHQGAPRYSIDDGGDTLNLLGADFGNNTVAVAKVDLSAGSTATGLLMMRSSPSAGSAFVSIGLTSNAINIQSRTANGGAVQTFSIPFGNSSAVLKLVKNGSTIDAMYSGDGIDWASRPVPARFPARVYLVGVGIESDGTSNESEVSFEGLTLSPVTTSLVSTGGNRTRPNPIDKAAREVRNWAFVVWHAVVHVIRRVI